MALVQPFWPNTNALNNEFGGKNLRSANTLIINGVEDPFSWTSLNFTSTNSDITSYLIDCPDCGHTIDLVAPKANDPPALNNVRVKIMNNITNWFTIASTPQYLET